MTDLMTEKKMTMKEGFVTAGKAVCKAVGIAYVVGAFVLVSGAILPIAVIAVGVTYGAQKVDGWIHSGPHPTNISSYQPERPQLSAKASNVQFCKQ
ncbi:MAG: hypothetical protein WCD70_15490 [Alphaproteobacteria bacterium]